MAGSWSLLSNGVTSTFSCHVGWILEIIECPHRVFYLLSLVPNLLFPMFVEYRNCHVHTFAGVPVCTQIAVNSEP